MAPRCAMEHFAAELGRFAPLVFRVLGRVVQEFRERRHAPRRTVLLGAQDVRHAPVQFAPRLANAVAIQRQHPLGVVDVLLMRLSRQPVRKHARCREVVVDDRMLAGQHRSPTSGGAGECSIVSGKAGVASAGIAGIDGGTLGI